MIPVIPAVVLALAQMAPSVLGLFSKNETAGKAAEMVASVAHAVTGTDNLDEANQLLAQDSGLRMEFQKNADAQALALYQEETKRLETVNVTIRAEAESADPYVRRWRPHFGYMMARAFMLQISITMAGVTYATIWGGERTAAILKGITDLNSATGMMWTMALTVIGVAVHKRSQDKNPPQPGTGIMARLGGMLGRPK